MVRTGRQPRTQPQSTTTTKSSKPSKKSKPSTSSKKAASAALSAPSTGLDVYSYAPRKTKARGDVDPESRASFQSKGKGKRQQASEDEEEDDELMGFRGGGIVEFTGVKPKGLKMGMDSDEEFVGEGDEDEEIDSDEAEESEDDFKPKKGGKTKASSRSNAQPSAEIDLDEDEIDFDDEQGEGFIDASEMLDMGVYDSDDSEIDSGSDDGSDASDDEEMASASASDDDSEVDSEYEGALDKLGSFVEQLESRKRKNEGDDSPFGDDSGKKKKRVVLKERTEAYPEGEFVAVGAHDGEDDGKLNLDDLLSSFADSKNPRLAALRKTLKPLASSTTPSSSTSTSHLKSSGPLAAPLPGRLQDKIDREAAYEKTKEETDKWNETVRRMKGESGLGVEGARHERLTLPLMGGEGDVRRAPNAAEWSAKFQPTNALESSIQSLLHAGAMSSSDLRKAEATALASLDPADVAARQAELRQQRDLMYRAERKAKRVAKIKSKAFRRIHRKAKGKEGDSGLSLEDLEEMDRMDGGDRVGEEQNRMEIQRARERATLKHSSKGGRWSRTDIGGLEGLDDERNSAVREMVKRNEMLRKRIRGEQEGEESADEWAEGDSEDELGEEVGVEGIRRRAMDELKSLEDKEAAFAANQPKVKGVVGMKFMQDAIKRGDRKALLEATELQERLERMGEQAVKGLDEEESPLSLSEQVQGNSGRRVFGPSSGNKSIATPSSAEPASLPSTSTTNHTTKLNAPLSISTRSPLSTNATPTSTDESNPWLADAASASKLSRKSNKATVGKDSRDASRLADKVARHKSRQSDAREAEQDDATVDIDPSNVLASAKAKAQPQITAPSKEKKKGAAGPTTKATMEEDERSSDEDDEEQHEAQRGRGQLAFKQRELVARAFAGDNVVADFEAEKRREIERDAPREEDNTLPGWGSWGGKGAKKSKHAKKFITKIPGIAPSARQDATFTNVIISEKKDKKAQKYLLKDLPFPYTSAAQHEHKLRTPMGPEWSTSTILRDQTLPSVLIKPGVTIRPVDKKV
ncbi:Utp14 protein-domain-containing protein [Leucosporidium creatinivorum]|uniref:Utp14 protein-domain-containing protein n=1 Tax=Leucosporidium creatinivorum TaxID=106004 RepID=A0A1Y2FJB9_9BASI|nr:Utp14 protein-domain-containing protein [Leucosporidium creatinivorum]